MTFLNKLKQSKGESISEVLVAALIGALGALLFANMAVSSTKIAEKGINKVEEYIDIENQMESTDSNLIYSGANVTIGGKPFINNASTVNVYGNSEEGLYAYKKN